MIKTELQKIMEDEMCEGFSAQLYEDYGLYGEMYFSEAADVVMEVLTLW